MKRATTVLVALSLLLPAGELTRIVIGSVAKIDGIKGDFYSLAALSRRHGKQQKRQFNILVGG